MDEALKKWAALGKDAKIIAQALFQASEGKVTKLNCRTWDDEDSVWEKALKIIFPGQNNTQRDRFFLWSFWIQERKGIFDEYVKLRKRPLSRNLKTSHSQGTSQSQGKSRKDEGHCFCQRTYKLVQNVPMLQCDQCELWFHGICADRNPMDFKGDRSFVCDICNGKAVIPPIFDETPKSSPAGHSQSRELPHHTPDQTTTPKMAKGSSLRMISKSKHAGMDDKAAKKLFKNEGDADINLRKEDYENISSDESLDSEKTLFASSKTSLKISQEEVHPANQQKFDDVKGREEKLSGDKDITIEGEEYHFDLLEQQIEEEAFRQDQDKIQVPISKDFTSQLSLHIDSNEEPLDLKNPKSPQKRTQRVYLDSDTDTGDEETGDKVPVKSSKSLKSDDSSEEENDFIDTSDIPSSFSHDLTYDIWRKFVRTQEDDDKEAKEKKVKPKFFKYTAGMRIDTEYTNVFSNIFDRYNWLCVLAFKKNNFNPNAQRAPFMTAYATCKKPPKKCPVKYSFIIQETPKIDVVKDLVLEVKLLTSVGPLHEKGYRGSRRLHGKILQDLKKELKQKKASTVRSALLSSANTKAMESGKLNDVKTLSSLRENRKIALQEEDLEKDVLLDILATRVSLEEDFPNKKLPGYVQTISVQPFKILMFTKMQFDLLNRITKRFGPRTLQMDATGQLCRPLPAPYDQRDVQIYTIIVRSPKTGEQVLPVAEMLSTDGTTATMAYFLKQVFESYRKTCNVKLPYYGIDRIEVDFSKANLAAIISVFTGLTVSQYLDKLWNIMADESGAMPTLFPVHVCRFHIIRALEAHLKKGVGVSPDVESKVVIRKWFHRLTHAKSLWTFHRLCTDAAFFFGQLYLTKQLLQRIENIDTPTDKSGTMPWKKFNFSNAQRLDISFYKRSPYGAYAEDIFEQMAEHNKKLGTSGKNIQYNPMYDPSFLELLKLHYMPYFPIISFAVMEHLGVKSSDSTTNAIEQYHGLLKTRIYPNEFNIKASRFLRRQAMFIKGSCNNHLAVLASIKNPQKQAFGSQQAPSSQPASGCPPTSQHQSASTSQPPPVPQSKPVPQPEPVPQPASASQMLPESIWTKNKDADLTSDNISKSKCYDNFSTQNDIYGDNLATQNENRKGLNQSQEDKPLFDESDDGLLEDYPNRDKSSSKTKVKRSKSYPYDDDDRASPESQRDIWKGKAKRGPKTESEVDFFDIPLIRWGGNVSVEGITISIGNSCAMDTTCQVLLALYTKNEGFKAFLDKAALTQEKEKNILQTILSFMKGDSDIAKSIWLTQALGLTRDVINSPEYHSEDEYGWMAMKDWFPIKRNYWCSNEDCEGFQDRGFWVTDDVTLLDLHPFSIDHFLTMVNGECFVGYKCTQCMAKMKTDVRFEFKNMPFLFYGINENVQHKAREAFLRYTQRVKGVVYKIFAYTILLDDGKPSAHYVTKFVHNYKKIVYDGLNRQPVSQIEKTNEIVTSVWLCPES